MPPFAMRMCSPIGIDPNDSRATDSRAVTLESDLETQWQQQLTQMSKEHRSLLARIQRGVEKESLRVDADGALAQSPHPRALGSALTHGRITTDYSESLMEFITPVSTSIDETLQTLTDIHSYVYRKLGSEYLWSASMPCIVAGDAGIPIAEYGSSNVGRMKSVYRLGLGHRYGRMMQAIAGVHYNFSMPDEYWVLSREADNATDIPLQDYVTDRYLGLIRNFHRWSWLLIYLFGASPAVCASFMRGRGEHPLETFDAEKTSLYLPHATALRMGDLGYNSSAQSSLRVCYNSLDNYLRTLTDAILCPHEDYIQFNGKRDGEYMQLNESLLQIENEFYSTIRPKRPAQSGETALTALKKRGIEYVEVRCIDVSPFEPLGISADQARFVDSFLLYCLTMDSPQCDNESQSREARNLTAVVNRGREPGLTLESPESTVSLENWAHELLDGIAHSAAALDEANSSSRYSTSLELQRDKVRDVELTPSARVLREMREQNLPFAMLARKYSQQWAEEFRESELSEETYAAFEQESSASLERQQGIEDTDTISFEDYIAAYYEQYKAITDA